MEVESIALLEVGPGVAVGAVRGTGLGPAGAMLGPPPAIASGAWRGAVPVARPEHRSPATRWAKALRALRATAKAWPVRGEVFRGPLGA